MIKHPRTPSFHCDRKLIRWPLKIWYVYLTENCLPGQPPENPYMLHLLASQKSTQMIKKTTSWYLINPQSQIYPNFIQIPSIAPFSSPFLHKPFINTLGKFQDTSTWRCFPRWRWWHPTAFPEISGKIAATRTSQLRGQQVPWVDQRPSGTGFQTGWFQRYYCWWTISCTTKDDDYPILYRVLTCFNHPSWCRISSINSMLVSREGYHL